MKKITLTALALLIITPFIQANTAQANNAITNKLLGRILLSVQESGEAWYIDPASRQRTYMRDGAAAYSILEDFGLGITNENLQKIPIGLDDRFLSLYPDSDGDGLPDNLEISIGTDPHNPDTDGDGFDDYTEVLHHFNPNGPGRLPIDQNLINQLRGRILLQVEKNGEAWYVNPVDDKRYYLPDGETAYQMMRYFGLGITVSDLNQIPISQASQPQNLQPQNIIHEANSQDQPNNTIQEANGSNYERKTISTSSGNFNAHIVTMRRDSYLMKTHVAYLHDCESNCPAKPLANYISENGAQIGMNGSYFCPPDYSACAGKHYSFLPPFYDYQNNKIVRQYFLKFHNRPMVVQTSDGDLHYFHRDTDFGESLPDFEQRTGKKITGIIGSWPGLIRNGVNIANSEPQEPSFGSKVTRGGIGWNDEHIFLVNTSGASIHDLATIFETLGAQYAVNLDGGGSSAINYYGDYKIGPGRLLPNAITFTKK